MTARVERFEYASHMAASGSVAYDLNRAHGGIYAPPYDVPVERPARPKVKPRTKVKTRTVVREHTKEAPGISVVSILGFMLAAALLVMSLLAHVQLTEVSAKTGEMQAQLAALKEEETQLVMAYENAFNLTEVESYATGVLGMSRASADQVVTLNMDKADKAVVLKQDKSSFGEEIKGLVPFVSSLMEYFK